MQHVNLKELPPSLRNALHSVGYRKSDVKVETGESFTPSEGRAVFGGSRGFIVVVDLATGRTKAHHGSWGGASVGTQKQVDVDDKEQKIPPNAAVIMGEAGGRGAFAKIRIHPSNMAKLLPAPGNVTKDEAVVLAVVAGLKSSGRKEEFERQGFGTYEAGNPLI